MKTDADTENKTNILSAPITLHGPSKELFLEIQNYRRTVFFKKFPRLLYHYTNVNGLIGIISGSKFWATHINYLNDASEILYACEIVNDVLSKKEKAAKSKIAKEFIHRAYTTFNLAQIFGRLRILFL